LSADELKNVIGFDSGSELTEGWAQQVRPISQMPVVVLHGELKDDHNETHPYLIKR
jgi:hypothetical protein